MFPTRRSALVAIALLAAGLGALSAPLAGAAEITVFAAASLKNALDEAAQEWGSRSGDEVAVSLAGSSALARQIQQGAPADVFISANVKWMDTLAGDGLIVEASRHNLLGNAMVLVAHGRNAPAVPISSGFDLAGLLGDGKLAMALVDSVPAGIYGKAALTSLGVWNSVEPKVAQSDNVRAALALVARGEAPYGIVYATDAAADDNVSVVGTFPADSHEPIVYPAALVAPGAKPEAKAFLDFLASPQARPIFEEQGFTVLE